MKSMDNPERVRALARNLAKEKNVSAQIVLQMYMMERFLERISTSAYRQDFILKGGFLLSSIFGLERRTTMDMDATLRHHALTADNLRSIVCDIASVHLSDGVRFHIRKIGMIRKEAEYYGLRVSMIAEQGGMRIPLKLDITTGDIITPIPQERDFPLILEDRSIPLLAYNLETVLAEKLHAILWLGEDSTRLRDVYDVYIIWRLKRSSVDLHILQSALNSTAKSRSGSSLLPAYPDIIEAILNSSAMQERWKQYQKEAVSPTTIPFHHAMNVVQQVLDSIYSAP